MAQEPRKRKDSTRSWARSWVEAFRLSEQGSKSAAAGGGLAPVAGVAAHVAVRAQRDGHPVEGIHQALEEAGFPAEAEQAVPTPSGPSPSDRGWVDPWLIGAVHEQAASADDRSARGAWYTPRSVVEGLVALAASTADHDGTKFEVVVDPTCGGGAFLLAGLDYLLKAGLEPREALARIQGTDIDPGAVTASRWSVLLWAALHDVEVTAEDLAISQVDALSEATGNRRRQLVVGNPPFASPLRKGVIPQVADEYRQARSDRLGPYADLAAIHLLRAVETSAAGSVVGLVQPQSLLSGRDSDLLRRHLSEVAPLRALWASREPVFDAGVRACAVILGVGEPEGFGVALAAGLGVEGVEVSSNEAVPDASWSELAAQALGAPTLPAWLNDLPAERPSGEEPADKPRRLGDLVSATAGFRDEYYGLLAACSEHDPSGGTQVGLRLVTVGLVDPLDNRWGSAPCRFGGQAWDRPTVAIDNVEPARVRTWTEQRLRPKLVVATQSPILEPVIDREGTLVPATPLLSVEADPENLNRVAAVLLAPAITAWAWRRWFGSAMSVDALKLAASQVELLPLPVDEQAWAEAAEALALGEVDSGGSESVDDLVVEVARIMNRAYRADERVFEWWHQRYRKLRSRRS